MLLCPDCRAGLPGLEVDSCPSCGWHLRRAGAGVPVMLSTADQTSSLFAAYTANYERIANDDLMESIQPAEFLDVQADRLQHHIGDVSGRRVCDVGIGQGLLFERLRHAQPMSLTGIDIAPPYLERFSEWHDVELVVANAENLPFREEFDVIVAADVLEHVLGV